MDQSEKKKSKDFNIYYLNFSKVYEIAMMINNVILTKIEMSEKEKKQLYAFDYSSLSALRDIKQVFNNRLLDYFVEKGV